MIKVFIGGSQGSKWTIRREVRSIITDLLQSLVYDKALILPPFEIHSGLIMDPKIRPIEYDKLIVLSGHCPVGIERYYCIECNKFITNRPHNHLEWTRPSPLVKTYDQGGVDSLVEIECHKLGIEVELHPAPAKQWHDNFNLKGYRSRNLDMANAANFGYALDAKGSCKWCRGTGIKGRHEALVNCPYCHTTGARSGALFVVDKMKSLGKQAWQIVI